MNVINKPSVSIGIPVHNEESNIVHLIRAILEQQKHSYRLEKIYIVLDGSTDSSERLIKREMKRNKKIVLLNDGSRKGKGCRLNEIYSLNTSSYLLTFDADVAIERTVIDEMMSVMLKKHPSFVAAHQIAIKPDTFVGKLFYANHLLWDEIRVPINNGDHVANVYGGASLLTDEFAKSLSYPSDITCFEGYMYAQAKRKKGFAYALNARVYNRIISDGSEAGRGVRRTTNEKHGLINYFGDESLTMYNIDIKYKLIGIVKSIIKRPMSTLIGATYIRILQIYTSKRKYMPEGTWVANNSTKERIILS